MKKTIIVFLLLLVPFLLFASLDVYYIDVGQADFEVVVCDGHYLVIDGGNVADGQLVYSVLKRLVPEGSIDYYVGTHAHEDHMGAAASVLSAVTAKTIFCPNNNATQKFFKNFLNKASEQNVVPTCPKLGSSFMLGEASVKVLGPFHPNAKNANNTSIILKITYGSTSFLFMGDAEIEEEKELVGKWKSELKADVIKVGHHGSDTSSSYVFLREVMPTYGVICVAKKNSYGHPSETTLSRYRDAETTLYTTSTYGDIHFHSDGETITINTSKGSSE